MSIVDRINNLLCESQHGQVAGKVLKTYGIPFTGNVDKLVNAISTAHGVPRELVPQVIHHIASDDYERDQRYDGRTAYRSRTAEDFHSMLLHPAPLPYVENAVDRVRQWHRIATHPHGAHALMVGNEFFGEDALGSHESRAELERGHNILAKVAEDPAYGAPPKNAAHQLLVRRARAYNPMRSSTWFPAATKDVLDDPYHKQIATDSAVEAVNGSTVHSHAFYTADAMNEVRYHATRLIDGVSGVNPSIPATHTFTDHSGTTFKAYTLDTSEKADDRCWGSKFCISTNGHAENMNRMYHGGRYKTTHIVTKVSKDGSGAPIERIHSAYLPELLPGQAHADPEQAVRNSNNSGALRGSDFDRIHPLLSKLDPRIDSVAHHYRNPEYNA